MLYHSRLLSLLTISLCTVNILASPMGGRYRNIGHRYNSHHLEITNELLPRAQKDRSSIAIHAKALPTIPVQGPKSEEIVTITKTMSASRSISTSISTSISATTILSTFTSIITHEVTVSVTAEPPKNMQTFTLTVGEGESIATLPGEVAPTPLPVWSGPIAPAPSQPPPPSVPIAVRQAAAPVVSEIIQSLPPPAPSPAPLGPHYDELYGYTPIGVGFSPPPIMIGPDGSKQTSANITPKIGSSVAVPTLGSALSGTLGIPVKCTVATPQAS